jgi:hypothetical protein
MITRAQAEALLTLAEALEVCEREGWGIGAWAAGGYGHLDTCRLDDGNPDKFLSSVDVRLTVSELVPKSIGS